MIRKEFNEWLKYHKAVFPQVSAWLLTVASGPLLERWAEAFEMARLEDAKACTDRMLTGQIKHPANYDLHMLPATVLRHLPYRAPRAAELAGLDYNPHTGEVTRKKTT